MIKIRKSNIKDIDRIYEIYQSAKAFMRENNNMNQWNDGYPDKEHILRDIHEGWGYVGEDDNGDIIMAFAFILGEDVTYNIIKQGYWLNDESYGTIHRIASSGAKSGILKSACDFCFNFTDNIRIDTHEDNLPMQNALKKLDFIKCGIINCRDGSPRIAYQKVKTQINE